MKDRKSERILDRITATTNFATQSKAWVVIWVARRPMSKLNDAKDSSKRLRIAIVGSGIAGLTTAFLLAKAGHHVEIFEREAEVRDLSATQATHQDEYRVSRRGFRALGCL